MDTLNTLNLKYLINKIKKISFYNKIHLNLLNIKQLIGHMCMWF